MQAVKGMVLVAGATYRIVRVMPNTYDVIRILDDARVGTFRGSPLTVIESSVEPALLREIARAAVHGARTSWVGKLNLRDLR